MGGFLTVITLIRYKKVTLCRDELLLFPKALQRQTHGEVWRI